MLEGKREYVAHYNFGTTFWQGRNRADYPKIAKELKTNLKDLATYFHATAQKSKKADEYREAARWYRTYLESFPDDPDSFGTNYLLAETLFQRGLSGCRGGIHEDCVQMLPQSAFGGRRRCGARFVHQVRRQAARG